MTLFNVHRRLIQMIETHRSNELSEFIRKNRGLYEESYNRIVGEMLLRPPFMFLYIMAIGPGTYAAYKRTGLWWHPFCYMPILLLAATVPLLKRYPPFSRKQTLLTHIMAFAHVIGVLGSIQAYTLIGTFELPGSLIVLCMIAIWFTSTTPYVTTSFIFPFALTCFFYLTLRWIDPVYAQENSQALIQGGALGLVLNFLMGLIYRYRFYFTEQEKILRGKAEKISKIFDTVGHAIFQIYFDKARQDLVIRDEKSRLCTSLLGDFPDGALFSEFLLDHIDLPASSRRGIREALLSIIEEPVIAFELNEGQLPEEFKLQKHGKVYEMEAQWKPLCSAMGIVQGVLVSLTDVTAIREGQRRSREAEETNRKIIELVQLGREKTVKSLYLISGLFENADQTVQVGGEFDLTDLFIPLHTIKGNARTLGLKSLAELAHSAEAEIDSWRKAGEGTSSEAFMKLGSPRIVAALNLIRSELASYEQALDILGWNHKETIEIEVRCIRDILQTSSWKELRQLIIEGRDQTGSIELFLSPSVSRLSRLIKEVMKGMKPVLKKLEKPEPRVIIQGSDLWLCEKAADAMIMVLPHIFANALDHGIEAPSERARKGKAEAGVITIAMTTTAEGALLSFADDGRGIIPRDIQRIAVERGLIRNAVGYEMSELDQALLIFENGFSSRNVISDISGRGVGTSAVREALEAMGGSVGISFTGPVQPNGARAFSIDLFIPKAHLSE